jgi:sigma-B regulation protein RsbU (phosphoserine phosphatase)
MTGQLQALLCAPNAHAVEELRRALGPLGYELTAHALGSPTPEGVAECGLVLIDGSSGHAEQALALCRRLRPRLDDHFVPILFLTDDLGPASRLGCFEAGADAYLLRPFIPGELAAQVKALARIKATHDRLTEKTSEINRINKRLQQAYQQIDQELALAQRLQASFLPQSLPQVPHVRFAVHYLLCGRVGGDFYDIFRLDEQHVGFYVADAMGHGVPASLLTIFVKKGVKPKEVFGNQYRLLSPGEVMERLNRDMIDQQLSEHPFITMSYALLNHIQGTIQIARAGHPYPLYVPREGPVQMWKQEGLLLGVVDARFQCSTHTLHPGDKVLMYTDGVDHARFEGEPEGLDSLIACAQRHQALPVQEFVARLARDLFTGESVPDDLTLLALERAG